MAAMGISQQLVLPRSAASRSSPARARASAARSPTTLAEAGAGVCRRGAPRGRARDARAEIVASRAGVPRRFACDLARSAQRCCAMRGSREPRFGAPDILVNAAGINPRRPIDAGHANATGTRRSEINLAVPFFLAQRVAPAMCERGWGRIINIASLQSVRAFADGAPYGASKGGVMQLTRALAQAWSSPRGQLQRDRARDSSRPS